MVDVFISYSRANQDVVRRLAEAVKAEGYRLWWDDELPPHLSYGDVITEKIGAARAAIVVWSESAAASEWVRAEADVARTQKKLIQASVDDSMPPMPFNQIQFASLVGWNGEADHSGWRKIKASLEALCGEGEGPRHAMPAAPPPQAPPSAVGGDAAAVHAPPPAGRGLLLGLLGLLVLLAGAAVLLLWMDGGEEAAKESAANDRKAPAVAAPVASQTAAGPVEAADDLRAAEESFEASGEILPGSDTRLLTEEDLDPLSKAELFIARNEIFARHGRAFQSPQLQRHFARFDWYRPRAGEIRLSDIEQANVRLIAQEERER